MKWQSGKGQNAGCGDAVIKHFPHPIAFEGFWETIPTIYAAAISPMWQMGHYLGFRANYSPRRSFIAAFSCSSPKYRRLLRHLLRLSN